VARKMVARSRLRIVVIQIVLLVAVAGLSYLLVLLLGSDLQGTLLVSGVLSK
jgi:hypothetical protein